MIFAILLAAAVLVPGAVNPNVTQDNIGATVCVANWTRTIRPPSGYTSRLKRRQMATYHLPGSPKLYEEDHFIPLSIGGHPRDPANLWPQLWAGNRGARKKDVLEVKLHRMVCAGRISLAAAQTAIRTDWIGAYKRYVR